MIGNASAIKTNLEEEFDIPFSISEQRENGEPCYFIGPQNTEEAFFQLKVSFSNRVRITIEYLPQKFSALFINSLGYASSEKKELAVLFASKLIQRGARIRFQINDEFCDPQKPDNWPVEWRKLALRITKAPVDDSEEFNYVSIVCDWVSSVMGMILSLANVVPTEPDIKPGEGTRHDMFSHRYERNPLNRKICLDAKGYSCCVCGMNFEERYGIIGRHFIHVHHLVPVSQMGDDYSFNPLNDLVPVCPNCHAMLHRNDPPLSPSELKAILHA